MGVIDPILLDLEGESLRDYYRRKQSEFSMEGGGFNETKVRIERVGEYFFSVLHPKNDLGFLGKLNLGSRSETRSIFTKFLDKFCDRKYHRKQADWWKIDYLLLGGAYQCFKRDPQELEQILRVAKTKRELKIHLGVS